MKKLLSIFSSFGVVMSSSLSINACSKKGYQVAITAAENKLEALKKVEVRMNLKDITMDNAVDEIKKMKDFTDIVDNKTIKLFGNLKVTKDAAGSTLITNFKHGLLAHVSGTIQHASNPSVEAEFNFTAKITDKHQAQLDDAEAKIKALENIEVRIENLTTNISEKTITDEIKKMKDFTDIVDNKTIKLFEELKLTKDITGASRFANNEFTHDIVVYVSGKIEHDLIPKAKADFTFSIKLMDLYQTEVNLAAKALVKTFEKYEVKMNLTTNISELNITGEIKKMKDFTDIVDNKTIKLFEELKLTKNLATASRFTNGEFTHDVTAYISGKIEHSLKPKTKADFTFAIKLMYHANLETKKVKFDLNKIAIDKIPSLYIDSSKSYRHLNSKIINSIQQMNKLGNVPLPEGHEIRYYVLSSKWGNSDNDFGYVRISSTNNQKEGSIWVEIVADGDDLTWKGSTNLMQFSLAKKV